MKYSKATNYALHTMVYLALAPKGKSTGVEQLAKIQNLSPTYLSKILTKLVKARLIESTPGVNGGYRIVSKSHDVSFLDVVHAVEGKTQLFSCSLAHGELDRSNDCLIEQVMTEAEQKMNNELSNTSIYHIAEQMQLRRHQKI